MLNVWVTFWKHSGPKMEPVHWAEWFLIGFDSALMRSKVQDVSQDIYLKVPNLSILFHVYPCALVPPLPVWEDDHQVVLSMGPQVGLKRGSNIAKEGD